MRLIYLFLIIFTWGNSEFIKSLNIVEDTQQKLMWQDNIEVTYKENITLGNVYCEELILNGYIDWRMPRIDELIKLLDQTGEENYLNKTFGFFKNERYWSITPNVSDNNLYWYVDLQSGKIDSADKATLNHIRCVREIQ